MTTLAGSRHDAGGQPAAPSVRRLRSRNAPLAVAGAVVVVGCSALFATGWLQAGHRQPVLALARAVTAGQILTPADLTVVQVSADGPVRLLPAAQETMVVGQPAAAALPAGSLLTSAEVGAAPPPAGQEKLGVAVKAGQYPPDLSAGQIVDVLSAPVTGSASPAPGGGDDAALPVGRAVVLSVTPQPASPGMTVVELQAPQAFVPQVAAAAASGQISLATIRAGG